jgi:hypothetical protein
MLREVEPPVSGATTERKALDALSCTRANCGKTSTTDAETMPKSRTLPAIAPSLRPLSRLRYHPSERRGRKPAGERRAVDPVWGRCFVVVGAEDIASMVGAARRFGLPPRQKWLPLVHAWLLPGRANVITYYASSGHGNTVMQFIRDTAPDMAREIRFVGYSTLDLTERPRPGLHIFTDFERLTDEEREFVQELRGWVTSRPRRHRALGDPSIWLDRHALLTGLHEAGINDFRSHRIDELSDDIRFPVFLRFIDQHRGSIGDAIHSRSELDARIAVTLAQRGDTERTRRRLLVIEQLDPRGRDGLYRKYSILRVGEAFIPRHLYFSSAWVTRLPDHVDAATAAEEDEFVRNPPDLDVIRRAFEISGVEFGRIDYGYVNGRPQVWEVNTNPMVGSAVVPDALRAATQQLSVDWVKEALRSATPRRRIGRRVPAPTKAQSKRWRAVMKRSRRTDTFRH